MFRRAVSLIVMLGFVAGQMAAIPHAHGQDHLDLDHDSRPHIHVSWHEHVGHSQGDDEHAHHHPGKESHSPSTQSETDLNQDGHDSDAAYLPAGADNSLPSTSVPSPENPQVNCTLAVAPVHTTIAVTHCSVAAYLPSESSSSYPLYLELRSLRI
jgi:hypothetical protein